MTTLTYSATAALRSREHDLINTQIATLAREFPHCTVGELYDVLIVSRYDLEAAREHCQQALCEELQLGEYLAGMEKK